MTRQTALLAILLPLLAVPVGAARGQSASGAGRTRGQVQVRVSGFRNERGQVVLALWRSDKGFPGKPPAEAPTRRAKIVDGVASVRFDDVAPGPFAVTVFHDEDANDALKTNFIGIPKEGIGFSRDARARIGAPDFEDARLVLAPGAVAQLKISMLYY
jgi:uncharacterized protein (DUF2141 family)